MAFANRVMRRMVAFRFCGVCRVQVDGFSNVPPRGGDTDLAKDAAGAWSSPQSLRRGSAGRGRHGWPERRADRRLWM
jgi:hypothetical protein